MSELSPKAQIRFPWVRVGPEPGHLACRLRVPGKDYETAMDCDALATVSPEVERQLLTGWRVSVGGMDHGLVNDLDAAVEAAEHALIRYLRRKHRLAVERVAYVEALMEQIEELP